MRCQSWLVVAAPLFGLLSCKNAEQKAAPADDKKIVLLGFNYGQVQVEELPEISVVDEAEKPADFTRVEARESSPADLTFGITGGKYYAYRVKAAEKILNGKVFTTRELPSGTRIKDLRKVGFIRVHGKTNGGVGAMMGMPLLAMEGTLVGP